MVESLYIPLLLLEAIACEVCVCVWGGSMYMLSWCISQTTCSGCAHVGVLACVCT